MAFESGLSFALGDEQEAIREMARDFAAEHLAPYAVEWDRDNHIVYPKLAGKAQKIVTRAQYADPINRFRDP